MRPINKLVIHHTAGSQSASIADITRSHVARGFVTIGYHYVLIKTPRGWTVQKGRPDAQIGSHAKNSNKGSIGVACSGNYEQLLPSADMLALLVETLADLCLQYNIEPSRKTIQYHGELPTASTLCCGKNLIAVIDVIVELVQKYIDDFEEAPKDIDDEV